LFTAGLMRGPFELPQATLVIAAGWDFGASEGKADWDSVSSSGAGRLLGLTGVFSAREGNGSGAPSSACLFYETIRFRGKRGRYASVYLKVSGRKGHDGCPDE
jgi:hypothetical protein